MPISYFIDESNKLIHEIWTGDIHVTDLESYWKDYLKNPRVLEIRKTLVDISEAKIHFGGSELSALIETIVKPLIKDNKWITAIVVGKPEQFGLSRQYQVFAEFYSRDAIFYEKDKAKEWLLQQINLP